MRGAPQVGSPPPSGRSALALPSTVSSYQSVFWPSLSNSSTVENQRDAGERPSQDSRARETASRHTRNDGRIPRRFCQPLPSGVGDACASAPPTVAGERDFPGAGFDAIESSGGAGPTLIQRSDT